MKLEQFRVLLVGDELMVLAKAAAILRNSPATVVTVVAHDPTAALYALAARHARIQVHPRPFHYYDLRDFDLLFVASADPEDLKCFGRAAAVRGILTNAHGVPAACSLYQCAPGPGTGDGALSQPWVKAQRLRQVLEELLPTDRPVGIRHRQLRLPYSQATRLTAPAARKITPGRPAVAWRRSIKSALYTGAALLMLAALSYDFTWPPAIAALKPSPIFYQFVAVGFAAQLIDGLLGMGYGVVATVSLMSLGLPPAAVSASIHTAEMVTSGAAGYHHYRLGNVNKRLFKVLLLPGIGGAVTGALLLAHFGERYATWVKPLLAVYLLGLGVRILSRAFAAARRRRKVRNAGWLAGAGGFLDSFGGGGWGPLVTSTLIANGRTPQYVIGTVSITEFFVTASSAFTFIAVLGISYWQIILGLVVGGVAAAPLAARLAGRIPTRWMFVGVGLMVICWSLWALRKAFF